MAATARLAGIGGLAAQVLAEEGPDVGAGDVRGPGSGDAGARADTDLTLRPWARSAPARRVSAG